LKYELFLDEDNVILEARIIMKEDSINCDFISLMILILIKKK